MIYLAEASPHIQAIYDARVAAYAVWKIILEVKTFISFVLLFVDIFILL